MSKLPLLYSFPLSDIDFCHFTSFLFHLLHSSSFSDKRDAEIKTITLCA